MVDHQLERAPCSVILDNRVSATEHRQYVADRDQTDQNPDRRGRVCSPGEKQTRSGQRHEQKGDQMPSSGFLHIRLIDAGRRLLAYFPIASAATVSRLISATRITA